MVDENRGIDSESGSVGEGTRGTQELAGTPKPRRRRRTKQQLAEARSAVGRDGGAIPEIIGAGSNGDRGGDVGGDTDGSPGGTNGDHSGGKPRKRRAGKKAPTADRVKATGTVLALIHEVAAQATGLPELRLNDQQSAMLSTAIVDCADAWGWNPVSDPRIVSSLTLAGVAFAIYAPKVKLVRSLMKEKKLEKPDEHHTTAS